MDNWGKSIEQIEDSYFDTELLCLIEHDAEFCQQKAYWTSSALTWRSYNPAPCMREACLRCSRGFGEVFEGKHFSVFANGYRKPLAASILQQGRTKYTAAYRKVWEQHKANENYPQQFTPIKTIYEADKAISPVRSWHSNIKAYKHRRSWETQLKQYCKAMSKKRSHINTSSLLSA